MEFIFKILISKIKNYIVEKGEEKSFYMEYGFASAKDEINGALNVAFVIVMSAFIIEQSIVSAIESTVVKCNFICRNECRYRLILRCVSHTSRSLIL